MCYEKTGGEPLGTKPRICEKEQNACLQTMVFGSETIRGCGIGIDGCIEQELLKTVVCTCKSDLCNTSFSIKSSVVIQLLAVTFSIIVVPHLPK